MAIDIDWESIPVETIVSDPVIDGVEPEITENYDEPDPSIVRHTVRPRNAKKYEDKAAGLFNLILRLTANHDETVADAAAIIQYGGDSAKAIGVLASKDERVARALDWIDNGTENPYAAAVVATLPLVLQVVRNHEPVLEPKARGFRIPFLKDKDNLPRRIRIPFKLGVSLGGLRNVTHDPKSFTEWVFGNQDVRDKMKKESIDVAVYKNTRN